MIKFIFAILLAAGFSNACADEASIRKAFEATYPKMKLESINKTQFPGLYEVVMDGSIFYTDESFNWFIVEGRLVDPKSRKDLTSPRLEALRQVDFNSLPLDQAIKVIKGNGARKVAVFSDPDCPFCRKLEKEGLATITDVTVYTFLFPLEGLHPKAADKAKVIWCAPDRVKAWNDWILNGQLPKSGADCSTPLEKNASLGRKLGISSTPTLIFENGKRLNGAYPTKDIEASLNGAEKK